MSSPQEYYYTAKPAMPHCQGSSCYCFYGKSQMDASFSDSDSEPSTPVASSPWKVLSEDSEWTVALNDTKFRHPRVLLAYFRFVCLHNEIADAQDHILIPKLSKSVSDFILNHISFHQTPAEFKGEVDALRMYVSLFSNE